MSTITKEWLQKKIAEMEAARDEIQFGLDEDDINTLAALRIALASFEAEPYGYTDGDKHGMLYEPRHVERLSNPRALFTVLPVPVSVPDEYVASIPTPSNLSYEAGWNACRAAMLQGAENAGSRCTNQTAPALDSLPKNAESRSSNSPMIPDCSCGTCRPVTFTDSRFVVCSECGNKRCPHANDHRNACTGSNEPGQEGSAYPAAPQQEV